VYAVLVFFIAIPLIAIWVWCVIQIVARPDLQLWGKALWIIGILVLPVIGAVAYLISSRGRAPIDETKDWEGKSAEEIEEAVFHSTHMSATDRSSGRPPM
jgi:Phospholipase_D-nuclease N-terminal